MSLIEKEAAINVLMQAYWDEDIQSAKNDPCVVDAMTDWAIRQIKALPPVNYKVLARKAAGWYSRALMRPHIEDPLAWALEQAMEGKDE